MSPPNMKGQEDLIYALEAEEERIVNVLSRKLEQVSTAFFQELFLTLLLNLPLLPHIMLIDSALVTVKRGEY
jgi:hypothetical protein